MAVGRQMRRAAWIVSNHPGCTKLLCRRANQPQVMKRISMSATARMEAARGVKQDAVTRELLWAGIGSRLWPSHLAPHRSPRHDCSWIVCIHSPAGQIAYRLTDEELPLFAHLRRSANDGHDYTGTDKIARLLHLATEGWG